MALNAAPVMPPFAYQARRSLKPGAGKTIRVARPRSAASLFAPSRPGRHVVPSGRAFGSSSSATIVMRSARIRPASARRSFAPVMQLERPTALVRPHETAAIMSVGPSQTTSSRLDADSIPGMKKSPSLEPLSDHFRPVPSWR